MKRECDGSESQNRCKMFTDSLPGWQWYVFKNWFRCEVEPDLKKLHQNYPDACLPKEELIKIENLVRIFASLFEFIQNREVSDETPEFLVRSRGDQIEWVFFSHWYFFKVYSLMGKICKILETDSSSGRIIARRMI